MALAPIVSIRKPPSPEAEAAMASCGNQFWQRSLTGSDVLLIPVRDGIPWTSDFIIVPPACLLRADTEAPPAQRRGQPAEDAA